MRKVYRSSYCNIAAVASLDKNIGLFRERDNHQIRRLIPELYIPSKRNILFNNHAWRAVPDIMYEEGVLLQVLYGRGWVFLGESVPGR